MFNRREFLKTAGVPLALTAAPRPRKSCILLMLTGGPSQLDTWDPKPEAPAHIRSAFAPIKTNVPGIEISELFPLMARRADQYAILRGCHHQRETEPIHELSYEALCGAVNACVTLGPAPSFRYPRVSGGTSSEPFEARCRQAVRLVESHRAQVITVHMFDSIFDQATWDTHGSAPFSPMRALRDSVAPRFDAAFTGLLTELERKGLLEDTLVVATGEFGRTPRINPAGGRDHWTECWTMLMAGGGVRGGQVIGASDAHGAAPKDRPVSPREVAATIAHALGAPTSARPVLELFG